MKTVTKVDNGYFATRSGRCYNQARKAKAAEGGSDSETELQPGTEGEEFEEERAPRAMRPGSCMMLCDNCGVPFMSHAPAHLLCHWCVDLPAEQRTGQRMILTTCRRRRCQALFRYDYNAEEEPRYCTETCEREVRHARAGAKALLAATHVDS